MWNDLSIFRRNLKHKLLTWEKVECDAGYEGESKCRHKGIINNRLDAMAKEDARSRHENVNCDIKTFGCLGSAGNWRHQLQYHKFVFAAAAVITQITYEMDPRRPRPVIY